MVLISIVSSYLSSTNFIVYTPPPILVGEGGGWVEPSTKFSKRRSLTGSQRVVAGKDRGDFFQGVAVFT